MPGEPWGGGGGVLRQRSYQRLYPGASVYTACVLENFWVNRNKPQACQVEIKRAFIATVSECRRTALVKISVASGSLL